MTQCVEQLRYAALLARFSSVISCVYVQDMDQQLSDARMRIVQLTAEVQSSKQAAQHHEERTTALQAQVHLTWALKCPYAAQSDALPVTKQADTRCMYGTLKAAGVT